MVFALCKWFDPWISLVTFRWIGTIYQIRLLIKNCQNCSHHEYFLRPYVMWYFLRFLIIHWTMFNPFLEVKCKSYLPKNNPCMMFCQPFHCSIYIFWFNPTSTIIRSGLQGEEFNTMTLFLNVLSAFEIETYAPWRCIVHFSKKMLMFWENIQKNINDRMLGVIHMMPCVTLRFNMLPDNPIPMISKSPQQGTQSEEMSSNSHGLQRSHGFWESSISWHFLAVFLCC